MNISFIFIKV